MTDDEAIEEFTREINSDLDGAARLAKGMGVALAVTFLALLGLWCYTAQAQTQTLTAPSRISPYDWACLDASGAVLSNHQRFDTAFVACYNNPAGAEIVGGRYRIAKPAPPDPQPTPCPAKPADETRPGACPTGTTGSWTQTRTYASVEAPTCWLAGEWTPATAPSGACVTPPPATPPAPTNLAGSIAPNAANPANSNVTLTWDAIAGVTTYEVERCTGANCSNFAFLADATAATYTNTNLPPGLTFRYRVRAWKPAIGAYSAIYAATTPTTPPPSGTGTATLQWTPPTTNTDGTPVSLAGYRIEYGLVGIAGPNLNRSISVAGAGVTTYVIEGLTAGEWGFGVRAVNTAGHESLLSNIVTRSVP